MAGISHEEYGIFAADVTFRGVHTQGGILLDVVHLDPARCCAEELKGLLTCVLFMA